jgi:putative SOS response-associated peptidase YedK
MCGRYTLRSRGKERFYGVSASQLPLLIPRYNIAPSQDVPAIIELSEGLLNRQRLNIAVSTQPRYLIGTPRLPNLPNTTSMKKPISP